MKRTPLVVSLVPCFLSLAGCFADATTSESTSSVGQNLGASTLYQPAPVQVALQPSAQSSVAVTLDDPPALEPTPGSTDATGITSPISGHESENLVSIVKRGVKLDGAPAIRAVAYPGCVDMDYHGGPVIARVKIQNVFWGGSYWNDTSPAGGAELRSQVDQAWRYIGNNPAFYTTLKQYGNANQTMGNGQYLGAVTNNLDPPASVSDADVQSMLSAILFFGLVPSNEDSNMLYVVYLPAGTESHPDKENSWGAHHFAFVYPGNDQHAYYATITPTTSLDLLTLYASHEIDEAVADPDPGGTQGWDEIGDPCQDLSPRGYRFGPYLVEQVYSRVDCTCSSPAPPPLRVSSKLSASSRIARLSP